MIQIEPMRQIILSIVSAALICYPALGFGQAFDNNASINTGYWSDVGQNSYLADNFNLSQTYKLDTITWQGFYGSGITNDAFTIQFFQEDSGAPEVDPFASFQISSLSRTATGNSINVGGTDFDLYEYSASISPTIFQENNNFWISIYNSTNSAWNWGADDSKGTLAFRSSGNQSWSTFSPSDLDFVLDGTVIPPTGVIQTKWSSGVSGLWDNAANWDSEYAPFNGLPHPQDSYEVTIDAAGANQYFVDLVSDTTIDKLTIDSVNAVVQTNTNALDVSGGQINLVNGKLEVATNGTIRNATIIDPNQNLDSTGTSFLENVDYQGNLLLGSQSRIVADSNTSFTGTMEFNNGANLTILNTSTTQSIDYVLDNVSQITFVSGSNRIETFNEVNLTIGENVVVEGTGFIRSFSTTPDVSTLKNMGTIRANVVGTALRLGRDMASFENHGEFIIFASPTAGVEGDFEALQNKNFGLVRVTGNVQQGIIPSLFLVRNDFENLGNIELLNGADFVLSFNSDVFTTFTQNGGSLLMEDATIINERADSVVMQFNDGVLKGTGLIMSSVNFDAELEVGQSAGTLTIENDWTYGDSAVSLFEVGGTTTGVDSDYLEVQGDLILDGDFEFDVINGFETTATSADVIELISGLTLSGEFNNAKNGDVIVSRDGLFAFTIHYGSGSVFDSNSVFLSNFQSVPEPSGAIILLMMILVFAFRFRSCSLRKKAV